MNKIIIGTHNPGKAKEFKDLFKKYDIEAFSLLDLSESLPDIVETGKTFSENARLKAEGIATLINKPVLADDSGLVIDALDGRPGIYSARYAGDKKDDKANINKVLSELKGVHKLKRGAHFVCVLALARPNKETIFKTGYCEGNIGFTPTGNYGFGYDPIFIPKGFNMTMAEMAMDEKSKISHRSKAILEMEQWLQHLVS